MTQANILMRRSHATASPQWQEDQETYISSADAYYEDETAAEQFAGDPPYDDPDSLRGSGASDAFYEAETSYYEDENDDSFSDEGYENAKPAKNTSSVIALIGVFAVVVLGGGGALAWKLGFLQGGSFAGPGGSPPIIHASAEPAKIVPPPTAAPGTATGQDMFSGNGAGSPARIVNRVEQPIAVDIQAQPVVQPIPQAVPAPPQPAPLVVQPIQPLPAQPVAATPAPLAVQPIQPLPAQPVAATPPPPPQPIQPVSLPPAAGGATTSGTGAPVQQVRRVKTVKIMADGSMVTGEAPAGRRIDMTGGASTAGLPQPVADPEQPSPLPPARVPDPTSVNQLAPNMAVRAGQRMPPASQQPLPQRRPQSVGNRQTVVPGAYPAAPAPLPAQGSTAALPPVDVPSAPQHVASLEPPGAPVQQGSFVVQIASTKSEAESMARFRSLQQRHGSIIGSAKPSIRKADLGERGIFYRVRVGPAASLAEATALCQRLKSSGADCVPVRY